MKIFISYETIYKLNKLFNLLLFKLKKEIKNMINFKIFSYSM